MMVETSCMTLDASVVRALTPLPVASSAMMAICKAAWKVKDICDRAQFRCLLVKIRTLQILPA